MTTTINTAGGRNTWKESVTAQSWQPHNIDGECYSPVTSSTEETATVTATTMYEDGESYVTVGRAGGTGDTAGMHEEFV